jgi:hypothetical protein
MALSSFETLERSITDLAREIGQMDTDDPARADCIKDLFHLTELSRSPGSELDKLIQERINELIRKIEVLEPGDHRLVYIVSQIGRLSTLISK